MTVYANTRVPRCIRHGTGRDRYIRMHHTRECLHDDQRFLRLGYAGHAIYKRRLIWVGLPVSCMHLVSRLAKSISIISSELSSRLTIINACMCQQIASGQVVTRRRQGDRLAWSRMSDVYYPGTRSQHRLSDICLIIRGTPQRFGSLMSIWVVVMTTHRPVGWLHRGA